MSRLLYEVAVLNQETRNQIQWSIEPICTSINCTLHPPSIFNVGNIVNHAESNFCADSKVPENSIARKASYPLREPTTSVVSDIFETAQTISGYSSGSLSTHFSDFVISESNSNSWLKNSYIVNDVTSGAYSEENVEWNEDGSDVFIETVYVEAPAVLRNSDQGQAIDSGNSFVKAKDKGIGNDRENEESKELITKAKSFRDALLGFGVWNGPSSYEEKSSSSNSEVDLDPKPSSLINPPMSLSVPESGEPCTGLRSQNIDKMVKLVELGEVSPARVLNERNGNCNQNGQSNQTGRSVLNGHKDDNAMNGHASLNGHTYKNYQIEHNGHSTKHGQGSQNVNASRKGDRSQNENIDPKVQNGHFSQIENGAQNGYSQNGHGHQNGHSTKNGHDEDFYSARTATNGHHRSTNGYDDIDESKSEGSLYTSRWNSCLKVASSKENIDSVSSVKGKSKNKKKRQKLAFFSQPTYQNGLLTDSLNEAPKTSPTEEFTVPSVSPPTIWKINENVEFDTNIKEFPSLHQNHSRNHKQDASNNNSHNKKIGGSEMFSDSGLGTTQMEETLNCPTRTSSEAFDLAEVQIEAASAEVHTKTTDASTFNDIQRPVQSNEEQNINKRFTLQGPPYKCKIQHGEDFRMLRQFLWDWTYSMPGLLQTPENLETLLSISQRIVRISVRKPYIPVDARMAEEYQQMETEELRKDSLLTYHYGTGFCFYIDQQKMYIQTHSNIVGSRQDAKSTLVQFNIHDLRCNGEVTIECAGLEYDFENNSHSMSSIFTCATPPELISYLHVFRAVPIIQRKSVFENDSCYFTDSSADSSFTGFEESNSDQVIKITQTQHVWNAFNNENVLKNLNNVQNNALTQNIPSTNRHTATSLSNNVESATSGSDRGTTWESTEMSALTWGGYLENYSSSTYVIKPPPSEPEPFALEDDLNIPLYKLDLNNNEFKGVLPVKGINNFYNPFSSYSADVIESSIDKPNHYHNVSPFIDNSSIWDYASLIYAQHDHRESYNETFQPNVMKHYDSNGKPCVAETKRELFSPPSLKPDNASDGYDYDLLNIDRSTGTVIPADADLERIVDDLVSDGKNKSARSRESNSVSEMCTRTAIMISYPHGGSKMVSSGVFSSKHFGGELYNVPTCVGCCGAPLLSFTEDRKIYVTDLVHSGTAKVDNRIQQFGLACYHGNEYSFSQKMVYSF